MNVIVSIGRNVGATPMHTLAWKDFQAKVFRVVSGYCTSIYFSGEGVGYYESSAEDSYTVIGEVAMTPAVNMTIPDHPQMVNELAALAKQFCQESIAVTFGYPIFAGAK